MAATMAKYGKNSLVAVGLLGARLNAADFCCHPTQDGNFDRATELPRMAKTV
jgi:hypothetical protein